jgi:hypothetical protein
MQAGEAGSTTIEQTGDERADAALDLDSLLEPHVAHRRVELVNHQLPEVGLYLVMAGLASQMAQNNQ